MPTGYTSKICDGEQSFSEFVLGCARAFGACIEQRDDPMDDLPKIPKKSSYHDTELELAKKELKKLKSLSKAERDKLGNKKRNAQIKDYKGYIKERKEIHARVSAMLEKVNDWTPPTKEHEGLKKFMLEQLAGTLDHDGDYAFYEKELAKEEKKTSADYYDEMLESAKWSVEYHREKSKEEVTRTNGRGKWITDLIKSLESDPELSYLLLKGMK